MKTDQAKMKQEDESQPKEKNPVERE